jgi:hypothetical protein
MSVNGSRLADKMNCTFLEYSTSKILEVRSFETSLSIYRSFVSFRPVEFSRGRLRASLSYSDSDSGLAGETKPVSSPCSLTYTAGPSASLVWSVTGQKPINALYQPTKSNDYEDLKFLHIVTLRAERQKQTNKQS